jgi:hypothetical protein
MCSLAINKLPSFSCKVKLILPVYDVNTCNVYWVADTYTAALVSGGGGGGGAYKKRSVDFVSGLRAARYQK